MMKRQGLIVTTRSLSSDRGPTFSFDGLPLVGVVFSLVPPLWELCCSLAMSIVRSVLRNVFGGSGVIQRENF